MLARIILMSRSLSRASSSGGQTVGVAECRGDGDGDGDGDGEGDGEGKTSSEPDGSGNSNPAGGGRPGSEALTAGVSAGAVLDLR